MPTTAISFPRRCLQRGKDSNFSSFVFFCVVAYNADNFSVVDHSAEKSLALLPTQRKIIGVVANNAEKCLNLNISTNSKPYANLHYGFNQGHRRMCFMYKS